jgi:hypothetical protein
MIYRSRLNPKSNRHFQILMPSDSPELIVGEIFYLSAPAKLVAVRSLNG